MDQIVLDFKELIVKFKDTKQKILICGNQESIQKAQKILNNHKDEFKDYEFVYHTVPDSFLVKEEELFMMSYEDTNIGKFMNLLEDIENEITKLPTKEEYENLIINNSYFPEGGLKPQYLCSECGGGMYRNEMVVLTTYPAKYEYRCNKCGKVDYQYA